MCPVHHQLTTDGVKKQMSSKLATATFLTIGSNSFLFIIKMNISYTREIRELPPEVVHRIGNDP